MIGQPALDLSEARARGRDSGPVVQIHYARTIDSQPRRPFNFTTHYNPTCLVRLMREVLANLDLTWRHVEAVESKAAHQVLLRRAAAPHETLAVFRTVSDHTPFTVEQLREALLCTRFGGPDGWKANPNHLRSKKGDD